MPSSWTQPFASFLRQDSQARQGPMATSLRRTISTSAPACRAPLAASSARIVLLPRFRGLSMMLRTLCFFIVLLLHVFHFRILSQVGSRCPQAQTISELPKEHESKPFRPLIPATP